MDWLNWTSRTRRKMSKLAKRNLILKATIVNVRTHPRTLRTPKNWWRMILFSSYTSHAYSDLKLDESIDKLKPVPKSYSCQPSNAPSNVKNAQKLVKNEPGLLLHPTCPLRPQIKRRILCQLTKRNLILKPTIISLRMRSRTSRTPKNWWRTNLFSSCISHVSSDLKSQGGYWVDWQNETWSWNWQLSAFERATKYRERPKNRLRTHLLSPLLLQTWL